MSRKCGTTGSDQDSTASTILTRTQSGPIDWNVCIFCNNKTHKNVKTLKKIESNEIISRILDASNHYSDSNMKSKEPTDDQFLRGIAKIIRNDIGKWNFLPSIIQHQRMHLSVIHFILCPVP